MIMIMFTMTMKFFHDYHTIVTTIIVTMMIMIIVIIFIMIMIIVIILILIMTMIMIIVIILIITMIVRTDQVKKHTVFHVSEWKVLNLEPFLF